MKFFNPNYFCRTNSMILTILLILGSLFITISASVKPTNSFSSIESRLLKQCSSSTNKLKHSKINIPMFSTYPDINYTAKLINLNETFNACPSEEQPSSTVTTSVSLINFENLMERASDENKTLVLVIRDVTLLLENGYLSVGQGKSNLTYYSPDEFCIEAINGHSEHLTIDFRTCSIQNDRPILRKCCPLGMAVGGESCVEIANMEEVWYPQLLDAKSLKPVSISSIKPAFVSNRLGCQPEVWPEDGCQHEFHPVTDNSAVFIGAHRTWERVKPDSKFCFDFESIDENMTGLQRVFISCWENDTKPEEDDKTEISHVYMVSMYVGAFFNFLTTFVYLITWPKQNIHGRTLCLCTLFLFCMNLMMGTAHLLGLLGNTEKSNQCVATAILVHYFMIGAFTWLVVVNFDLWRTFKSVRVTTNISSLKEFLGYSAFGCGFPLLVILISVVLNFKFECRNSGVPVPEYGERVCFVAPWAQGYFVYYILGVLIAISFVFSALTMVSLYRKANNLKTSSRRSEENQTVLLFLKLSVLMGFTWAFEVISWAATKEEGSNHWVWIILDMYNFLSAILIFIIFVCRKTTLAMLEQTIPKLKGLTSAFSNITISFTPQTSSAEGISSTTELTGSSASPAVQQIEDNKKSYGSVAYSKEGVVNEGFE